MNVLSAASPRTTVVGSSSTRPMMRVSASFSGLPAQVSASTMVASIVPARTASICFCQAPTFAMEEKKPWMERPLRLSRIAGAK